MNLPPCDFRGPSTADRCRCDCPRVRPGVDGLVPLSLCRICPQRIARGVPVAPPVAAPSIDFAEPDLSCVHRGAVVREERCRLCGIRDRVEPVHVCGLHGECTARKYRLGQPERICLTCPDRKPPDA